MATLERRLPRHTGEGRYPRLSVVRAAKSWMPASAGMTVLPRSVCQSQGRLVLSHVRHSNLLKPLRKNAPAGLESVSQAAHRKARDRCRSLVGNGEDRPDIDL